MDSTKGMVAFHGRAEIKEQYLARVRAHRAADVIVQGYGYWSRDAKSGEFKGCAVGCTLHSDDHGAYEEELGIPRILARLEDGIFEALPADRAKVWPEEFLSAPRVGADLSMVWPQFAVWLLTDETYGVVRLAKAGNGRDAITAVANLYTRVLAGEEVDKAEFRKAAADAYAYADAYAAAAAAAADAYAYADADAYAAYADADAAAAAAAAAAAYADAYAAAAAAAAAAADAAAAAAAAAYADAYAAAAAAAAADAYAYADARRTSRVAQADKLLELMTAAPVPVGLVAA